MLRLGLDIGGTKIEGLHTRLVPARHGDSNGYRYTEAQGCASTSVGPSPCTGRKERSCTRGVKPC
jgi:hypothetical protein